MRNVFSGVVPFVAVAEEGSFRAAATRLGLTAAAVSKAVRTLEEEIGAQLLSRTTRQVRLTSAGELFLARCREAMEHVRAGRALVAESQQIAQGELTVSLSPLLGRAIVARLPALLDRYPGLQPRLRFTDRFSRLIDEGIDVALRIGDLGDSTLIARRVMQTRWVTVAAPAWIARNGRPGSVEDLHHHACLRFITPLGTISDWTFCTGPDGATQPFRPTGGVEVDLGELLVEAAVAGLGVAQVFSFLVEEQLADGRLIPLLEPWAAVGPPIHALCLPGQQTVPRVRVFLDFLSEALGAPPQARRT